MSSSSSFGEKAARNFLGIVIAFALAMFLMMGAEGSGNGGKCVCYFTGDCVVAQDGTPLRYYQCTSSCYAYSGWQPQPKCFHPDYPRMLFH